MNSQPTFGPDPAPPDTKRLLLTVVLCTALFSVWQLLNPPKPQDPAKDPAAAQVDPAKDPAAPADGTPAAADPAAPAPALVSATPDLPERTHVVEADVAGNAEQKSEGLKGGYRATVTSHGAQLKGWELTGYVDTKLTQDAVDEVMKTGVDEKTAKKDTPAINIELADGEHAGARLIAIRSAGGDVKVAAGAAYEVTSSSADEVVLERQLEGGVKLTRSYRFDNKRFVVEHKLRLDNESTAPRTAQLELVLAGTERPGERDEGSAFGYGADPLAAVCAAGEERERYISKDIEQTEKLAGDVKYVGVDHQYFMAAVLPGQGAGTTGCRVEGWKESRATGADGKSAIAMGLDVVLEHAPVTIAPGGKHEMTHTAYLGPKQIQMLQEMGSGLDENVEFGWFGVLSRPMLWVLVKLFEGVGNFGFAIILLTLLMKLITFPLTQKSYVSMQQMKTIAPEMKKLQEKYGSDRARLGQEQMKMYQEKGINPMAGCFPMLVQMPIWFALYRTLWNSVELYQQPFAMWITDLSQPDISPLFGWPLLPLLVGALMFFQTTLQPPPQDQPQMKYVMWGMPIMFTFFMLQMPSGLSLYMITNSILTMAQQIYIKRKYA
jgi:YidC/Oxa1 family membrane protein insertase